MIWKENRTANILVYCRNSIKNNDLKLESMPSKARLKKLKICEGKHTFCSDKYSQKYFPCVSKMFPVLQQNSLCFPCLEKVRTKIPVFPVPWSPCTWLGRCRGWHRQRWKDSLVNLCNGTVKVIHYCVPSIQ